VLAWRHSYNIGVYLRSSAVKHSYGAKYAIGEYRREGQAPYFDSNGRPR
jgi:hypothetical protein